MRLIVLLFAFSISISNAFSQIKLLGISNDLDSATENMPWINNLKPLKGDAFKGELFSRADSVNPYGLGYKGSFPSVCLNRNLTISIGEYIRIINPVEEIELVVTVSTGDSLVYYHSKNITPPASGINSWTAVHEQINLPASITGEKYSLAVYLWNKEARFPVDIDDLKISFEEMIIPSFLPAGFSRDENGLPMQKVASDKSYSFYYAKENGRFLIMGTNGDTIISSLALFSEWNDGSISENKRSWNKYLFFRKDSATEEGLYIRLTAQNEISTSEILILSGLKGSITFRVSSRFTMPVTLIRQSFITGYSMPVTQVYRKNTLTDSTHLEKEYWLDREGFMMSDNKNTFALYHPEKVSSVQLDVINRFAFFNLDYNADHPLLHFPLLNKSQNKFVDHSTSIYKTDDQVNAVFTFYPVSRNFKIVKQLSNPYGFLSSFTWTEHADYTNMRTQRAVYFGAENIQRLEDATGGFLKYSIPVTKSIFYANPDKVDNSEKAGFMPGPVANYRETEGYRDFLKQLYEYGIEICLHTPDHFTCSRSLLSEALDATRRDFSPSSWIDHGYDNSKKSNREDLACDGADSTSEYYSADLWKKYGIKYFWNSFFEDSDIYKSYNFNSFFSVPYSGWDDAMPTPLYWKNKTRTGDIIHWRTTSTMDPPDGSLWQYYFSEQRLNDAVNNRSDVILHCYPARVDSTTGFYSVRDGVVNADAGFNQVLSRLSQYRAQKKIRLTTVRELLDYRSSSEKISYEILPGGTVRIKNEGKDVVRGISFSAAAKNVKAGNKQIEKKVVENELIFWFDIFPGEVVDIDVNNN